MVLIWDGVEPPALKQLLRVGRSRNCVPGLLCLCYVAAASYRIIGGGGGGYYHGNLMSGGVDPTSAAGPGVPAVRYAAMFLIREFRLFRFLGWAFSDHPPCRSQALLLFDSCLKRCPTGLVAKVDIAHACL